MIINSNFEINTRSVEEFARVMVPEALEKTLNLSLLENDKNIKLKMEIDGKSELFLYPNCENKIEEQKQTMTKILLLKFYDKNYSW